MLTDFLQFMFNLIIAGFFLRYAQTKLMARGNEDFAKALAFIY